MPPIESLYRAHIDAMTPAERVARSAAMFQWTREQIARQIIAEQGPMQEAKLKWSVAMRLYGEEPLLREWIQGKLAEMFENERLPVVSRVDAAASKLIWISKGSHKSRRDLRAIVRSANEIQRTEIQATAQRLGLANLMIEVLGEPDEIA